MRPIFALLAAVLTTCLLADEPQHAKVKPPYERLLQGKDAERAAALEKRIAEAAAADQYAEAIARAEELAALRKNKQGTDHYEFLDAEYQVHTLQKIASLPPEERRAYRDATNYKDQAAVLDRRGKYTAARPLYQKALAIDRKVLGEEHPQTAMRYNDLALNLDLTSREKFAEARPLYEKALAIRCKVLGEEHPATADSYNILAVRLYNQRKYAEAKPLYEKALAIRRKVFGEEHLKTADSYDGLAINLDSQGKYAEAQPLFQKRLSICRKVLGEEDYDTAWAYKNLADNLSSQRKYAAAQPFYQKALAIRRKVLGEEHLDTAESYNNLAFNLTRQRKYAEAQPLFQEALVISRKVNGEEDPDTAWGYKNLADNLTSQRKYAEAQPFYQKALAIRRKVLGEDHLDTAESCKNLADNLGRQRKHAEAQPLYEKALAIRRESQGEEHLNTADSYNSLADNLKSQRKYAEAQPLYEKALAIRRKVLGEEHLDTAQVYDRLADNLARQGKYAEAQPFLEKSLAIDRKVFGYDEEDPGAAQGYNKLAENLNSQGRYAEAQLLLEKALAIHRKQLGEEDADTAQSYSNLADNLNRQGKYAESQPLFEKALAINRKVLGEEHPDTADSYLNLGLNLCSQMKFAEAQPLFDKAMAGGRKVRGEHHPDTASGYDNLAFNLNSQGKYAEAQPLYEKALAIDRKVLGEEHLDTAQGYNNLADNLTSQRQYAKAQPLLEKALAIRRKVLGEENLVTAQGYSKLALNLGCQGKNAEAQSLLEKALAIHRKLLGDEDSEKTRFDFSLACNLNIQGRYAEAQPLFQKKLAIDRKVLGEEHPDTAQSYNSLALNLDCQGKYAEAQPLYEKALAIDRKALGEEHPDTAESYFGLGVNLNKRGEYAEAATALGQAARSYEASRLTAARGLERAVASGYSSPYPLLAAFHARSGDAVAATRALEMNLARGLLDEQALRATLLPREAERQGVLQQELAKLRSKILALLTGPNHTEGDKKELQALLGERQKVEQQLADLAIGVSQREVETFDRIRQALPVDAGLVAWVDERRPGVQEHWVCLCRQQGLPVWERLPGSGADGKWTEEDTSLPGRLRQAVLGENAPGVSAPAEVARLARQLYAQRLAPLEKHLAEVRRLYVVPVDAMSEVPIELLTDQFTISYVPSGTVLARGRERARPKSERVLALGDPRFDDLPGKPAGDYLPPGGVLVDQAVPQGNAANSRIAAGDVLLTYAGTELKDVAQLGKLIADHAGDKSIPVTIWRDGQTVTRDVAPGNLSVLLAMEPAPWAILAKQQGDRLLASLRGEVWTPLPGTRVELARLSELFGKDRVRLLEGEAASEPVLDALRAGDQLRQYRFLHFATHGEANNLQAFQSRLVLTQNAAARTALPRPGQPMLDGYLTAAEVLEYWKLDAELVTLSACESALGRAGSGDGSLGFAQAFLKAGSRAVCLSLWKVDDTATALLMDRFYRNLLGKRQGLTAPLPKAEALAEAKTWLRNVTVEEATDRLGTITQSVPRGKGETALRVKSQPAEGVKPKEAKPFAQPRYWAAFILIGDPD
jgi:tetratricopeptide (TPR) repeat protein